MSPKPLDLFVQHRSGSSRAAVTCAYKCGNACFHEAPNTSSGTYFRDIVAAVSRRRVLQGGAAAVLAVGSAGALAACGDGGASGAGAGTRPVPGTDFGPVAPNTADAVLVPEGYEQGVVIRWGDPLFADAPQFDAHKQTAAAQLEQFGYNNDFAGLLPIEGATDRYLLVSNHEYTTEPFMFPDFRPEAMTREQFEISVAAHGLTVVELKGETGSGKLTPVFGKYNRRITAASEFRVTGPAAGSALLKTSADPTGTKVAGTFANCSGGITPWGTILSGEENFHGYFVGAATDPTAAERARRYSVGEVDSPHYWERFDPRFDPSREPNEPNRFGWVVELDPWDPHSVPVKHTALGRFKHEAANIHVTADGTVVAYCGDDERFEYLYKFVSSRAVQPGTGAASRRHNLTVLDAGTLYVAKLSGDHSDTIDGSGKPPSDQGFTGSGQWIPLLRAKDDGHAESLVPGMAADEVAVFTRLAGDEVGATKMDRPEDFEPSPKTGKVYVALTNNTKRGTEGKAAADEANPRNENKNGQILELTDDHAGTEFTWSLLLVCGDPAAADTYYGGFDKSQVSPISCPDNVAFDPYGNLWISTDGNELGANDGLFAVALDDQRRGETKQFLSVPAGAETCGPVITEDRVLVSVQHPGEVDGASADAPASHWPDGGESLPRPAVVSVWRAGGGRIGI